MDRRTFLASTAAASLPAAGLAALGPADRGAGKGSGKPRGEPFALQFAPHFGMFRHHAGNDLVDQLQFMHDEGFRALEDNGMPRRSVEDQSRVAAAMERLGMTMGVFVAHADFGKPTFAQGKQEHIDRVLSDMRHAVEVAQRVRARWCTVVPGTLDPRQDIGFQTANVVELLKRCADVCAPTGLVMVLEPLNFLNHPNLLLTRIPQAYQICRAVDHPSCKILDDLYHQQIQEGNLIPNLDRAWPEIAYFQVGDNPGRNEPNTGEIHYANIFAHLKKRGFEGIIGMEHGNSLPGKDGEAAVIAAYRAVDPA